jgi:hypothetical protein
VRVTAGSTAAATTRAGGRILVVFDGSGSSRAALRSATELAISRNATIDLVGVSMGGVWQLFCGATGVSLSLPADFGLGASLAEACAEIPPNVSVRTRLLPKVSSRRVFEHVDRDDYGFVFAGPDPVWLRIVRHLRERPGPQPL